MGGRGQKPQDIRYTKLARLLAETVEAIGDLEANNETGDDLP